METVLTIAGFDPSSGAGVTADLMVFAAHRLFGTSCITALTVQNTLGVSATHPVPPATILATLDALFADLPPAGIKIGMLANVGVVSAVAAFLSRIRPYRTIPIVLDPVLQSTSGTALLDPAGVTSLRQDLLPLVSWITPNLDELGILLGGKPIAPSEIPAAAADLQRLGKDLTVVVTGGHLDPPVDHLLDASKALSRISGQRIESMSSHGTGCAFSSALLSRIVLGDSPLQATSAAKAYVAQAMLSAKPRGSGHGPLDHLWPLHP